MDTCSASELSREDAKKYGYAVFNGGNHLCVTLPNEAFTISVKTPDQKRVTFAFTRRHEGEGHQCVDIVHHGENKNDSGFPLQKAAFLGAGPTNAICRYEDASPTTVIVLSLPEDG